MRHHIERRRHPRYEIAAQIRVKHGRVNYIMEVANISLSGMLVLTDELDRLPWFRVDQVLDMEIFGLAELENIPVNGRIVHLFTDDAAERIGFGVRFIEVSERACWSLTRLIERAARGEVIAPPLPAGYRARFTRSRG